LIITRTPLRISFFGGGTDVLEIYSKIEGAVFATTFCKYIYIFINHKEPDFGYGVTAKYSKSEKVEHPRYLSHPIMRQILLKKNLTNLDISVSSDLPGGSGLGSSSAFTVGFLQAVHDLVDPDRSLEKEQLASDSCRIEIEDLKEPIGKQDAYSVSFGGLKGFIFESNDRVRVVDSPLSSKDKEKLERCIRLVKVGASRRTSELLSAQLQHFDSNPGLLDRYERLADHAKWAMKLSQFEPNEFGARLTDAWNLKKSLSPLITSEQIDNLISTGLRFGASGAKLLGAGGSGYVLFIVPEDKQMNFDFQMGDSQPRKVKLDTLGSVILFGDSIK